jgi:hypothetical protein
MSLGNEFNPVFDAKEKRIVKIGIVVHDAVETAKRYSALFDVGPWTFSDQVPTDITDHGKQMDAGAFCLRCGTATLGRRTIELIQPLYGKSPYKDFLGSRGEGIHHVSFSEIEDPDACIRALAHNGITAEMAIKMEGCPNCVYLDTQEILGTVFEIKGPADAQASATPHPWGNYQPSSPVPVSIEGKEIVQLGIVVRDVEKAAKAYWHILGIGPWVFADVRTGDQKGVLHGVQHSDSKTHIKVATADTEDIQFELLQPVGGASSHMDFLNSQGTGIHHVSFGDVADHDQIVSAMQDEGIGIEMQGVLGDSITFTYFATQRNLGTIYEVLKIDPDIALTLVPTGMYPPP